jgi:hypothetical protein
MKTQEGRDLETLWRLQSMRLRTTLECFYLWDLSLKESNVIVIYCCFTNTPKFRGLKHNIYFSQFLWLRNPGMALLWSTIWSSNTTLGDIPKRLLLQRHLHIHVYCSTIHNSQVMETAKMPQHWRMD